MTKMTFPITVSWEDIKPTILNEQLKPTAKACARCAHWQGEFSCDSKIDDVGECKSTHWDSILFGPKKTTHHYPTTTWWYRCPNWEPLPPVLSEDDWLFEEDKCST